MYLTLGILAGFCALIILLNICLGGAWYAYRRRKHVRERQRKHSRTPQQRRHATTRLRQSSAYHSSSMSPVTFGSHSASSPFKHQESPSRRSLATTNTTTSSYFDAAQSFAPLLPYDGTPPQINGISPGRKKSTIGPGIYGVSGSRKKTVGQTTTFSFDTLESAYSEASWVPMADKIGREEPIDRKIMGNAVQRLQRSRPNGYDASELEKSNPYLTSKAPVEQTGLLASDSTYDSLVLDKHATDHVLSSQMPLFASLDTLSAPPPLGAA